MSTRRPYERPLLLPALAVVLVYLLGVGVIAVAAVAASGDAPAGASGTTIEVTLTEFAIEGNLMASAGPVKLKVTNTGTVDHNVGVEGTSDATTLLGSGETETLDLGTLTEGEYVLFCSVAGHKDAGMTAKLMVHPEGESTDHDMADGSTSSHGGMTEEEAAKMDADMLASVAAYPAETEGVGNQILEPTAILPDGTKQFDLTAEIADWEVEPGRVVEAWTYNGMVPAPMLKLDVGDRIRVVLHNELPVSQDVHWHGIEVPFAMDGVAPITQEPTKPGEDFVYEFTLDKPYMGMYHPHMHGVTAVPNGMFGVIQVGPTPIARGTTVNGTNIPADVQPAVDIPMVLNDAGVIGFSLNGKSFPATAPIVVNQGDWVAITYYNEGLQSHPMHLHEFPQLVTAKDGFPLPEPYWVDTLMVGPGERYTVMFQADEKGTWVFHCHILSHVERETGMFGMVTAIVVQ